MSIVIRTWNLFQGLASRLLSFFERRNPEALLELEKENLRKLMGRFNAGLISHAALSERLMTQLTRGETEQLYEADPASIEKAYLRISAEQ